MQDDLNYTDSENYLYNENEKLKNTLKLLENKIDPIQSIKDEEILQLCADAKTYIENPDNLTDYYMGDAAFIGSNKLTFNYVLMRNVIEFIQKNGKHGTILAKSKKFNSFQELNDYFKDEDLVFVKSIDIVASVKSDDVTSHNFILFRGCAMRNIDWVTADA